MTIPSSDVAGEIKAESDRVEVTIGSSSAVIFRPSFRREFALFGICGALQQIAVLCR